jgi:hypothetical protein
LWKVVVWAFAIIHVISVFALVATLFIPMATNNSQVIVTVFTGSVAFLAGLFAPSPAQGSGGSGK